MAILSGDLKEVDIPSVLELARQMAEPVQVLFESDNQNYRLVVAQGEITHAESPDLDGPEAFYKLFTCKGGHFEIIKGGVSSQKNTIQIPWNTLLLQGLQRLDETGENSEITSKETITMASEKLEKVLQEMATEVEPGLRGIGVAGSDGMGLAFHKVTGDAAENLSAQVALIMQVSRRSIQRLEKSEVEDVLVTSGDSYLLGRFIDGEHFLFVNVNRDSVLGNVRLVMRNYTDRLLKAIPR